MKSMKSRNAQAVYIALGLAQFSYGRGLWRRRVRRSKAWSFYRKW